jgi:protein phosphatase
VRGVSRYDSAWRRYAWDVAGINDLKLAPFHLLAIEGAVHADQDHAWHMRRLAEICACDPGVLLATAWREVALDDEAEITDAISWWGDLTRGGGEGIVMKPGSFIARGTRGVVQPALKVRGAEYLRIIYDPNILSPASWSDCASEVSPEAKAGTARVRARTGSAATVREWRTATPRP